MPLQAQVRFKPADDTVVLQASAHRRDGQAADLKALDQARRERATEIEPALDYARAVFMLGLTEGDLRWWGRAKAALQPWWNKPALPAEGHYLRALIKQGFHEFEPALADLDKAVQLEPGRAEFWSWRFALNLLLSRMDAAREDCDQLERRVSRLEAEPCRAILLYRTGQPAKAVDVLATAAGRPEFSGALAQDWLRFHLGEAHRVAGQSEQALAVWQAHLQARPQAHMVRVALADLLNQLGRHEQARQVAAQPSLTDALLVQALLAARGLKDSAAEARLAGQMRARLQSQDLRGEAMIERPRMIFLIRYGEDLRAGLALAEQNWKEQNEPADAVLLLEAALQLGQPRAAAPVLAWAQKTGYTEPRLAELIRQVQGGGK